jgi:LPXTG-motif cell wall-anchored protein
LIPVTLALAVVTLLLLLGLMTDPTGSAPQIPVILLGLVMTAAGGLSVYRRLRRLVRGG